MTNQGQDLDCHIVLSWKRRLQNPGLGGKLWINKLVDCPDRYEESGGCMSL